MKRLHVACLVAVSLLAPLGCHRSFTVRTEDLERAKKDWKEHRKESYIAAVDDDGEETFFRVSKFRAALRTSEDGVLTEVRARDVGPAMLYTGLGLVGISAVATVLAALDMEQTSSIGDAIGDVMIITLATSAGATGVVLAIIGGVTDFAEGDAPSPGYPGSIEGPARSAGIQGAVVNLRGRF